MSQIYRVEFRPVEPRDCPVTVAVMILCVAASAYVWLNGPDAYQYFVMQPDAWTARPWLFFAGVFPHAMNPLHLVFNLLMFWPFGSRIEPRLGSANTALLYFFLAVVPLQAEYAFNAPGVGLSGVVYGQFGFLWAQNRYNGRLAGLIDRHTTEALVFWFFLCILITYTGALPVANWAHGVGAVLGGVIGWAAAQRRPARRASGLALIALLTLVVCLGATFGRRYLNPQSVAYQLGQEAIEALKVKDYERARKIYVELLDLDDQRYDAWFNLGLAQQALNQADEAMYAFGRAYLLKSGESDFRDAYLYALHRAGNKAALRDDFTQAEACWRRAVEIEPRDAGAWSALATVLRAQKRDAEAARADEQARRVRSGQDPLPESTAESSAAATPTPIPTSDAPPDATGAAPTLEAAAP